MSGMFDVHQLPAWRDNFIWLIVCRETGQGAVVDGPEAGPLLSYCDAHGIKLTTVLNTHTHHDHIGVNKDLAKRGLLEGLTVYGPALDVERVPGLNRPVSEGDSVEFGALKGHVWLTEGHLDGHISYLLDDALFCGDALFAGGCGYLFDGPPAKQHATLARFATLPPETAVFCAHEYTQDNLRFAWAVEPDNTELAARIGDVWKQRALGRATVPTTIGLELATNPFIRTDSGSIQLATSTVGAHPAEIFAATRRLKDAKAYRALSDEEAGIVALLER